MDNTLNDFPVLNIVLTPRSKQINTEFHFFDTHKERFIFHDLELMKLTNEQMIHRLLTMHSDV